MILNIQVTLLYMYIFCFLSLKGSCNHVVGMLFRVEYAVRSGQTRLSSTSRPCVWNAPPVGSSSDPVKLCSQEWNSDHYMDGMHLNIKSRMKQHILKLCYCYSFVRIMLGLLIYTVNFVLYIFY